MSPRFSVIIPLFNKRTFFARTLDHLLRQDLVDFEVVIVDDGSSDGGAELIEAHADPRLRLFRQANAGPGPARNRAAGHAIGEWLALLDADDLWATDHLSTLDRIIRTIPDAGFVSTRQLLVAASRVDTAAAMPRGGRIRKLDYLRDGGEAWANASNTAIRRDLFARTEGFGAFCPGEEMDLFARLALIAPFAVSEDATTIYLRDNDGIMERGEQRGVTEEACAIAPVEATLLRALADPRHREDHAGIRDYLDRLKLRDARIYLYRGDLRRARAELAALIRPRLAQSWPYRLLAALPSGLVAWGIGRYSHAKRARLSARGTGMTDDAA